MLILTSQFLSSSLSCERMYPKHTKTQRSHWYWGVLHLAMFQAVVYNHQTNAWSKFSKRRRSMEGNGVMEVRQVRGTWDQTKDLRIGNASSILQVVGRQESFAKFHAQTRSIGATWCGFGVALNFKILALKTCFFQYVLVVFSNMFLCHGQNKICFPIEWGDAH